MAHNVSKNNIVLACYNFDEHRTILIIFSRNVDKKGSNQMVLHFSIAAAPNHQLYLSWTMVQTNQSWTQLITRTKMSRFVQSTAAWIWVASQQNWRNQAAIGWNLQKQ